MGSIPTKQHLQDENFPMLSRLVNQKLLRLQRHRFSFVNHTRLKMVSLEERRKIAMLGLFFKIENKLVILDATDKLITPKRRSRHTHSKCYQIPSCNTNLHKNFYYPRTITDWNHLTDSVENTESLEAFKALIWIILELCF